MSSGLMPSRPATRAISVPWPRPVSAKEPKRPMCALSGMPPSRVRPMRPMRTAPAVCELDGPTITGPRISKMSVTAFHLQKLSHVSISDTFPREKQKMPRRQGRRGVSFPASALFRGRGGLMSLLFHNHENHRDYEAEYEHTKQ